MYLLRDHIQILDVVHGFEVLGEFLTLEVAPLRLVVVTRAGRDGADPQAALGDLTLAGLASGARRQRVLDGELVRHGSFVHLLGGGRVGMGRVASGSHGAIITLGGPTSKDAEREVGWAGEMPGGGGTPACVGRLFQILANCSSRPPTTARRFRSPSRSRHLRRHSWRPTHSPPTACGGIG